MKYLRSIPPHSFLKAFYPLNSFCRRILMVLILTVFISCQKQTDKAAAQHAFIENTLSILDELGNNYPPEDIDLLFCKADAKGFQTATFSLKGETKEIIQLGGFAAREYSAKANGISCTDQRHCGKEIAKCLENGDNALIVNNTSKVRSWRIHCVAAE